MSIERFLHELRCDPRTAPHGEAIASGLRALDHDGDGNPNSAAIYELMIRIATAPLPLSDRLSRLLKIVEQPGEFTVSRHAVS